VLCASTYWSAMRIPHSLLLPLALPLAYADVLFTSPRAGEKVRVGTIDVRWKDSGIAPSLSQLTSYSLALLVGGNENEDMVRHTRAMGIRGTRAPSYRQGRLTCYRGSYKLRALSMVHRSETVTMQVAQSQPGFQGQLPTDCKKSRETDSTASCY